MSWQKDAELAGTLYKRAKPYTAMLIARCVEVQSHGGDRSKSQTGLGKTTLTEFAEVAGIGKATVDRYLRAWDAMVAAGLVPARDELAPGDDVDLPDMKAWTYYYREANPRPAREDKATSLPKPEEVGEEDLGAAFSVEPTRVIDRYVRRTEDAAESVRVPGLVGDSLRRLSERLTELVYGDDPRRAVLHAMDAYAELVSALNSGQ